jgi:hypothetical protein
MKKNSDGNLNFVASLDIEELLKQAQFAKTQLKQALGLNGEGTLPIKISIDTKEAGRDAHRDHQSPTLGLESRQDDE